MIDPEKVAAFIRTTAAAEILPRFRALAREDIREKGPGDLVTVADIETERRLTQWLHDNEPSSVVVGEESVAEDRGRLDLLGGSIPVWVIDPIDGTGNFAKGNSGFSVLLAYVVGGVTEAGWIYEPLTDVMVMGTRGHGVWSAGKRLALAADVPEERSMGAAYGWSANGVRSATALINSGRVGSVRNRGSSGLEYLDIAVGRTQFSIHSRSLPWDHAAGMMLVAEAGGTAKFLDGSPYDPRVLDGSPLAAASARIWDAVEEVMTAPRP